MGAMRVLLVPDRLAQLTSVEVARLLREGWTETNPEVEVEALPLASGDLGFTAALERLGRAEPVTATDAWGAKVPCTMLVVPGPRGDVVYLEAAQVLGMQLAGDGMALPGPYGSRGVGELIAAALRLRPSQIVVGVGDTATLDGGLGLLRALAGDEVAGTAELDEVLPAARRCVGDTQLVGATSDDPLLLGLKGASARCVDLFGQTQQWAQEREREMGDFAQRARSLVAERRDLLDGGPQRLDRLPGSGAGGGLAFGLALLGAQLVSGPAQVAQTVGLDEAASRADLVVTVTETFDWRVLEHSVPYEVAQAAGRYGRPVVLIAREIEIGRRETMSFGISGAYPLYRPGPRSGRLEDLDVCRALAGMARRVAGTWTPPARSDVP